MDSFGFGAPAKARSRIGWPVLGGAGLVLLLLAFFVGGSLLSGGGSSAETVSGPRQASAPASPPASAPASAAAPASPLAAADAAADRQVQVSLNQARTTAAAAFMEGSSWTGAGAQQLSILDPSLTYVSGQSASTGPTVVSVEASSSGWAAAARSSSGRCFYVHVAGLSGAAQYGSGETCTGAAAMSASATSW